MNVDVDMSTQTSSTATPELPDLPPGISLLEADDEIHGALHALVIDQLIDSSGPAVWVDANCHVTAQSLLQVAPTSRVLDRISVARGFTAFQHYALVRGLAEHITDRTAAVVVPAVDAPYRADDLRGREGEEMLVRALSSLAAIARTYEVPVLISRTGDDEFTAPIARAAHDTVTCVQTPMGPRFSTDEFDTLVYPVENGLLQTTFAFWQDVLEARVAHHDPALAADTTDSPEVTAHGPY